MALQGHVELEKLAYFTRPLYLVEQDERDILRSQVEISQATEEQVPLFLESNRTDSRLGVMPRRPSFLDHGRFSLFFFFIYFSSIPTMSSLIHRGCLLAKWKTQLSKSKVY